MLHDVAAQWHCVLKQGEKGGGRLACAEKFLCNFFVNSYFDTCQTKTLQIGYLHHTLEPSIG